ncbi:MAG: hypothetical protein ACPIOQ_55980, partial [Promethearchaeia archaeon]
GEERWQSSRESYEQERCKFYVVPKSKRLQKEWQYMFRAGQKTQLVWNPHSATSVPPSDADALWAYNSLRAVIRKGDALCRDATVTHNLSGSQKAMRGCENGDEEEVEYEVVGLAADSAEPPMEEQAVRKKVVDGGSGSAAANDVWAAEPVWESLPPPSPPATPFRILIVGASNSDEVKLSMEKELDGIRREFTSEWGGDAWRSVVTFVPHFFTDMTDLLRLLLEFRPIILHFVCHGKASALSLHQDEVSVQTLKEALRAFCDDAGGEALRLVLANSCNSALLAQVLSEFVDFVIGHDQPVLDSAAIDFARVLYKALGSGRSLRNGFELARAVKDCGMYCLRGRKDAGKFVFPKPEAETVEPMTSFNVKEAGGYQARAEPEQRLEAWLAGDSPCPTFVLWGLGGSGKSTLGRTFAARLVERDSAAPVRLVFLLS